MRKILIIGAGQAGLQLALTLVDHGGYDVTLMTAQTPEEIRGGRITSTQCMFHPALQIERDAGLNDWEDKTPWMEGQRVTLGAPGGQKILDFYGIWDAPSQSVDQRVKMAGWLERLERSGGKVVLHPVATSELESLAAMYDLVIVAAGKGPLVELFERDDARSPYDHPRRSLAAIYLHGVAPWPARPVPQVRINAVPGVGEMFLMPALTNSGTCDAVLIEAVPGGPLDAFTDRRITPDEHLTRLRALLSEWMPWEYDLFAQAEPTDAKATLYGSYAPSVRRPVGRVGAQKVLGMADVVVLNDPAAGQGANNAAHCAKIYRDAIVARGDLPFDERWMHETFERYWDYAQWSTALTNALISDGLPEHVQQIFGAATQDDEVASRFARGYSVPPSLAEWFFDPAAAGAYLASRQAAQRV
ncbi:2-polyprenyl-6-methoxyphenol hydroxylase-like FAD-dependent oxidoreductase [Actinocorallia herbida]|uniref:2-polyprenyl-6-methoxyphenol hydroxylase-like FAD-dependent oxidoreductase n=1 Tax=Actinocorallia herbida TaxID=58109 RepID=A0A3N1D4Z9_9ACTN|nr:styrene monooxygenase/indole monooxygenase family protein [Actinocorallia herbida]ROO88597.1 2-polyprenyl-6-methoxyphenol hydroxylase-like FAD-dependent oxidoreductase [Actinocorallia herbida]